MIRVTIDAAPLLFRSAGVKNYFYYWTRHLLREARGVEIRLFPFLDPPAWLDHEPSPAPRPPSHALRCSSSSTGSRTTWPGGATRASTFFTPANC
jgi:hypothetical protein